MIRLLFFFLLNLSLLYPSHASNTNINNIEQKFEAHKNNLPRGDIKQISYIKKLIDYMYLFDQEFRELFIQHRDNEQLGLLLNKLDGLHTSKMKEVLKIHGWIVISKFGSDYDKKAWLLVQHADEDPFFQAGVLFLLERLANEGETDKKNYAYLYDRVATKFNKIGLFQKYGTQVQYTTERLRS